MEMKDRATMKREKKCRKKCREKKCRKSMAGKKKE